MPFIYVKHIARLYSNENECFGNVMLRYGNVWKICNFSNIVEGFAFISIVEGCSVTIWIVYVKAQINVQPGRSR